MKRSLSLLIALALSASLTLPVFAGGAKEAAPAAAPQTIKFVGHTMLPKEHV